MLREVTRGQKEKYNLSISFTVLVYQLLSSGHLYFLRNSVSLRFSDPLAENYKSYSTSKEAILPIKKLSSSFSFYLWLFSYFLIPNFESIRFSSRLRIWLASQINYLISWIIYFSFKPITWIYFLVTLIFPVSVFRLFPLLVNNPHILFLKIQFYFFSISK